MNSKPLIIFVLFNIIMLNALYSQNRDIDDTPFLNTTDYTKVLEIGPTVSRNKEGNIDWLIVSKKWREHLLHVDNRQKLQGYYGVLFIGDKTILFAELVKNNKSYASNFITHKILLNALFSEIDSDYFQAKIDVYYIYNKENSIENKKFGFSGPVVFIDDIAILPNLDNNVCFVIFRIINKTVGN